MLKRDDASAAPRATGPAGRPLTGGSSRPWMKKAVLGAIGMTGAVLGVRAVLRRAGQVYDHCSSLEQCSCDHAVGGCDGEHKAQGFQGGVVSDVDR